MSPKKFEVKKNHHHVWEYYLRNWSADGKNVWHTSIKGKISWHSIGDICREDYFYKSSFLTADHLKVIEGFSKLADEDSQAMHANYLSDIVIIQTLENLYRTSDKRDDQIERMFEAAKCNLIENYHSAHEREAKPIVSKLLADDFTPLQNDEELILLLSFLAHQFTRTKSFRDRAVASIAKTGLSGLDQDRFKTVLEECWFFISYMYGMNMGRSLFLGRERANFCILENNGEEPFITSDSPVINLCNTKDRTDIPEDDRLELYYPLSPWRAVIISRSGAFPSGKLKVSAEAVKEVNLKMARFARVHIIGNEEKVVRAYRANIDDIS